MAELVDALDLGSSGATHKSSILFTRTIKKTLDLSKKNDRIPYAIKIKVVKMASKKGSVEVIKLENKETGFFYTTTKNTKSENT